jgi:dynein heavy chain
MAVSHLFGWFASETNQWHDGIFSALWRSRAMKDDESSSWISFDGPVDPIWMEGLNSILDEKVIFRK